MMSELSLTLYEAQDTPDGAVRLDPSELRQLGLQMGDIMILEGHRRTYVRVMPAFMEDRNQQLARVSVLTARNIGYQSGQRVRILPERSKPPIAELVTLEAEDELDRLHLQSRQNQLSSGWFERTVIADDLLQVPTLDHSVLTAKVVSTQPAGPVLIGHGTQFVIASRAGASTLPPLGGLREIYRTCQDLVGDRFRKRLATSVRSVLLQGPPGCGKATLVSRLAQEQNLGLQLFDVPHLIDQSLSAPSTDLALSLSDIERRGPTLLLFDHLEALTAADDKAGPLVVAVRNVTAQITAMLDELPAHPNLMAIGVASGPLDARFETCEGFDLNIPVDAPNRWGRNEVLLLASADMSLAADVDLGALATLSAGTTARDLVRLVTTAGALSREMRVTQRDFMAAFRALEPSVSSEVRSDIPTTLWDEVAGLDDIKQLMRDTLSWSLHQYEKFEQAGVRPPRSILLSGGQGTGKTSLVRALAGFMPMHFIEIACSLLVTRSQAEGTQFLKDSFALARRKAPCLVFFDDIDVLFEPTANVALAPHQHPVVAQLMAELDRLASLPGVVVIAATNRPDRLTTEILRPGRFDFAVTLPLPDAAARKKVLQIHARKLPLSADVDFDRLAGATQGLSPAEIANLCNRVGLMALRQSLSGPDGGVIPPVVNADLFEQALRGRKS